MEPTALGRYLRESREARELTLDQAVQALRIRSHILEAFERGDFDVADTPVRVRGMLRNYAHFLGLDEERVLQYYEASLHEPQRRRKRSRKPETEPVAPRRITDTPPALPAVKISKPREFRFGRAARNMMMILVALLAIAFISFVAVEMLLRPDDAPQSTVVAFGDGTPTETYTPTWTPMPVMETSSAAAGALGISGINVSVRVTQRTWMRVEVDGRETFAGIREPDYQILYEGNTSVVLVIANAAGVEITYNGTVLPPYGTRGQQVQLEFSAAGVNAIGAGIEPTATQTPPEPPTVQASATAAIIGGGDVPIGGGVSAQPDGTLLPSPTPLFTQAALETPAAPLEQSTSGATSDPAQVATSTLEPATATPEPPTATPTLDVLLPPRATPDNPTPTKTG